jgi:threonine/homoserine/homoserine lactone efflux protein
MTRELFLALFTFAGIGAWTPGPNNTILLASGINHGFRKTLPMIMGVVIGFPLMIGVVGLGLGWVFETYPVIYTVLRYAGCAYMLWLAWKIATAKPAGQDGGNATAPMTFLQGVLFQWINPKGWVMAVTALSAYTLRADYLTGVAVVVGMFGFMGITSATGWAMFGVSLRRWLNDPAWFRAINLGLAVLLAASLAPLLWH